MSKKALFTAALLLGTIAIDVIPAHAQMSGQRIARALPPVQSAIPMGVRMIPSRRANPGGMRNGLPPTNLDSFVYESGGKAWHIYGDEGVYSLPPFMEFTKEHRIEQGINGRRRKGLTTGHGSHLPDAWGGDEFVDGPEWSDSGAGGTQSAYQPFEPVMQSPPGNEIYQTPPFVDDRTLAGQNLDPLPKITPAEGLKEVVNDNRGANQQALFGRQLAKRINTSNTPAFNWP